MPTTRIDIRRLFGVSLAVAALGLGIAACGGGDDESPAPETATTGTTETVALTKDSLIQQGDEICAEVNAALGSIAASTADETTKSSQVTDIYDGLAERLGQLGTPSDGPPPTEVIAAVQDLAGGSTDTTDLQTAASDYGFTDCAEAPEATSYPSESSGSEGSEGSSSGSESTETYTPPTTAPEETYTPPVTTPPSTGGGVAPTPTTPSTPSTGGGSGGTSSGGIGPG